MESDPVTKETTVAGVYVAGDAGSPGGPTQSAILAASSGAQAAYFLNHALAAENAETEIGGASNDSDEMGVGETR